jgi:hypothetical protein
MLVQDLYIRVINADASSPAASDWCATSCVLGGAPWPFTRSFRLVSQTSSA